MARWCSAPLMHLRAVMTVSRLQISPQGRDIAYREET
jgi:hypothetical protein